MTKDIRVRLVPFTPAQNPQDTNGNDTASTASLAPVHHYITATLTVVDGQPAIIENVSRPATNRPASYTCKACGEKGHNARSKTCGFTPEERAERVRVEAKIRSGLRK